jgi:hypothetical protein
MVIACGSHEHPGAVTDAGSSVFDVESGMHSGVRLKLQWYQLEGGRSLAGIFDSQRNERCTPRTDPDGALRCLPIIDGSGNVFADAGCSQPLGFTGTTLCLPADYFRITTTDASNHTITKLYPRNMEPAPTKYYSGSPVGCEGPFDAGRDIQLSSLGPEVSFAEFALLTLGELSGDGELQARYYESQDGARFASELVFDTEQASDCFLQSASDLTSAHCIATEAAISLNTYTNADCTIRGVTVSKGSLPKGYVKVFDTRCSTGLLSVSLPGNRSTTHMPYSYSSFSGCSPLPADPRFDYYEIGADAPLKSFARAPNTSEAARVQPIRFTDGQTVTRTFDFYDGAIDDACEPTELSDGSVRCLPHSGLSPSLMYSDGNCQTPIYVEIVPTAECGAVAVPKYSISLAPSCLFTASKTQVNEVRRVGGVYAGPIYSKTDASSCFLQTDTTSYRLSDPIPLDQLATATLNTEP